LNSFLFGFSLGFSFDFA